MTKIVLIKAKCLVCGKEYDYPEGGYNPSTCGNFDCLFKYLHRPQFKNEGGKYGIYKG